MGWFTRKKEIGRAPILASEIPSERYGPAPPPPRTPHAPGASRYAFGEVVEVAVSARRPGRTAVLPLGAGEGYGSPPGAAFVVLSGTVEADGVAVLGPGDSLVAPDGLAIRSGLGAVLLADVSSAGEPAPAALRFGRHDLAGRGFAGITGIRAVHRTGGATIVRLGPPPGARWVLVGLRAFAVFGGKLSVLGGDEPLDVREGELLTVADPTATLYLQSGNDSALAIGFGSPDVLVALG